MKNNKKIPIIKELYEKGNSVLEIALALRTSPQLIYYYIKKHDLKADVDKKHLTKKKRHNIIKIIRSAKNN